MSLNNSETSFSINDNEFRYLKQNLESTSNTNHLSQNDLSDDIIYNEHIINNTDSNKQSINKNTFKSIENNFNKQYNDLHGLDYYKILNERFISDKVNDFLSLKDTIIISKSRALKKKYKELYLYTEKKTSHVFYDSNKDMQFIQLKKNNKSSNSKIYNLKNKLNNWTGSIDFKRFSWLSEYIPFKFKIGGNKKEIYGTSFLYFESDSKARLRGLQIVNSYGFNLLIQLLTFVNILWYFLNQGNFTFLSWLEPVVKYYPIYFYFYLVCFSFEFLLKLFVFGVFNRNSYFSSIWNLFDFTVLIISLILVTVINFTVVRIFILLRFLDNFFLFSYLKIIYSSIWLSLKRLKGTLILFSIICYLYTVTGVDLFKGHFRRQCVLVENGKSLPSIPHKWCGRLGFQCPGDMICSQTEENPNLGFSSFDNFFSSLLLVFKIVSDAGWAHYFAIISYTEHPFVYISWFGSLLIFVSIITFGVLEVGIHSAFDVRHEYLVERMEHSTHLTKSDATNRLFKSLPRDFFLIIHRLLPSNIELIFHKNILPIYSKIQKILSIFVKNIFFELIIILFIFSNSILEVLHLYKVLPHRSVIIVNLIFTIIFTCELLLRLLVYSPFLYFRKYFNILDAFVIIVNLILTISNAHRVFLNIFLQLRLLRIIIFVSKIPQFSEILNKVQESFKSVLNLFIYELVIAIAFSMIGFQIFKDVLTDPEQPNFTTIQNSLLLMVKIFTRDGWEIIMYKGANQNDFIMAKYLSIPLFISFFLLSRYIVMTMFNVVVLVVFSHIDEKEILKMNNKQRKTKSNIFSKQCNNLKISILDFIKDIKDNKFFKKKIINNSAKKLNIEKTISESIFSTMNQKGVNTQKSNKYNKKQENSKFKRLKLFMKILTNYFRKYIMHKLYRTFQLLFIIISSVLLIFEDSPENYKKNINYSSIRYIIFVADIIFLIFFSIDAVVQLIVRKLNFFTSFSNYLNLIVVLEIFISSILFFVVPGYSTIKLVVRLFRIARPIRILCYLKQLDIYMKALKKGFKNLLVVYIMVGIVGFTFAMITTRLFAGSHNQCSDKHYDINHCSGIFKTENEIYTPRCIVSSESNFNSIFESLLSLLEIATFSNWSSIIWPTMKTDFQGATTRAFRIEIALLFSAFIILSMFAVLNLILGVIITQIERIKLLAGLTPTQRHWQHQKELILKRKPQKLKSYPKNQLNRYISNIVSSKYWSIFLGISVIISTIFLGIQFTGQPLTLGYIVDIIVYIILLLLLIDSILKIFSLGLENYLSINWHFIQVFFFIVLLIGMIVILIIYGWYYYFIRIFIRIIFQGIVWFRILRMISAINFVNQIIRSMISALPMLLETLILLLIIFLVYSFIGLQLFSHVKYGDSITENFNFHSVLNGILILIRVLTLEHWNEMMRDLTISYPYCTKGFDCGYNVISAIYFISFLMIGVQLMLGLLTGVILEYFSFTFNENCSKITNQTIEQFSKIWSIYDSNATGILHVSKLDLLNEDLNNMNNPLAFNRSIRLENDKFEILKIELLIGINYCSSEQKLKNMLNENTWNQMLHPLSLIKLIKNILSLFKFSKKNKIHNKQNKYEDIQDLNLHKNISSNQANLNSENDTLDSKSNYVKFNETIIAWCRLKISPDERSIEETEHRRKFLISILPILYAKKIQKFIKSFK